jgi:hypothetical protein
MRRLTTAKRRSGGQHETSAHLSAPPNAINATLYDKLNFNFIRDIAPVASMTTATRSEALPDVPTLAEFVPANISRNDQGPERNSP